MDGTHCWLLNILVVSQLQEVIHMYQCDAAKRLFICKLTETEMDILESMRMFLDKN
jgi:hypothetical protein